MQVPPIRLFFMLAHGDDWSWRRTWIKWSTMVENATSIPLHVPKGHPSSALAPGARAPDFSLHSTPDQAVKLSEFSGQPVVLAFYPADWSPVCGDQMALYNEILPEFQRLGAELIGISVDGSWCHSAFSRDRKLH